MNEYNLNDDELAIVGSVESAAPRIVSKLSSDTATDTHPFPAEVFTEVSELGLTALAIPEEFGGIGGSPGLQAAIYDTLAAHDLGPAIFTSVHGMVSGLISKFGSEELKARYLPDLASGKLLAAFALSEPNAGSDAAGLTTTATLEGEEYSISGEKCWITSAGAADLYLVFARTPGSNGKDGINAIVVDKSAEGLSIGPAEAKMGCQHSPIGSLYFDKCKVSAAQLIGEPENGYRVALGGLTGGRINIAACAVGIARTALEKTIGHLQQRKQFGKPLMEFQGLQFKVADMKMLLDASSLLVGRAARSLADQPDSPAGRLEAGIAKCFATDAAMQITTEAVQLHGALGYMKEHGIEKLMRDAKMLQIVEGANEVQRSIIARELFKAAS